MRNFKTDFCLLIIALASAIQLSIHAREVDPTIVTIQEAFRQKISLQCNDISLREALSKIESIVKVPVTIEQNVIEQKLDTVQINVNIVDRTARDAVREFLCAAGAGLSTYPKKGSMHIQYSNPMLVRTDMIYKDADVRETLEGFTSFDNVKVVIDPDIELPKGEGKGISIRLSFVTSAALFHAITWAIGLDCKLSPKVFEVIRPQSKKVNAQAEFDPDAKELNAKLNSKLDAELKLKFESTDIREILDALSLQADLNILLNQKASEKRIDVKVPDGATNARTVLENALKQAKMHYWIADDILFIDMDEKQ